MAKPASKKKKIRMNLDITEEVHQRLQLLCADTSADSRSEVIRRSIALYDFVVREKQSGSTVLIETADGKQKRLEFL